MTIPDFPPAYAGKWIDENRYEFDTAIELSPGHVMKVIDFTEMSIPEDMTRQDVLEAITDPHRSAAMPASFDLAIKCPQCGKTGTGSIDLEKAMLAIGADPHDPSQINAFLAKIEELLVMDGGYVTDKTLCPDCEAKRG